MSFPAFETLPLAERIAVLEQRQRYYDAAEGQRWFRETEARMANEKALLRLLYPNLEYVS